MPYHIAVGPDPIDGIHTSARMWKKNEFLFFVGMNSSSNTYILFDATFGSRRGAILQQYSETAHQDIYNVSLMPYQIAVGLGPIDGIHTSAGLWKKNKFLFFFGRNSSSNTYILFDATFGSRRGSILQQYSDSAHQDIYNVSLMPYQIAVGLGPIDGIHTSAGLWKKNKFLFFFSRNSSSNTYIPFDATFGSRRGAILQQYSESAHHHK
jgi:hypothetical protein